MSDSLHRDYMQIVARQQEYIVKVMTKDERSYCVDLLESDQYEKYVEYFETLLDKYEYFERLANETV